ncbi:MAG TPA: PIN domain-containing protein [Anaeromyxobacteraceae bacterium]|nr:PIN domain-containing protein [Anaeromyxobacteraceae bacterium]
MRFWDASAVVPLLADEPASEPMREHIEEDAGVLVWWATPVECASALARRLRERRLDRREAARGEERLRHLARDWTEVAPSEAVRIEARRLLRVHTLRAADALQLAAAIIAAEQEPASLDLVTLDDRLAEAAEREGFRVLGA